MSNERPDEFAAWRSRLQRPDALPEQGLADKDAAWDRLFDRLGESPRRRFHGYRIVAACILILLIPAARLFQDRPAPGGMRPAAPVPVAPRASNPAATSKPAAPPAVAASAAPAAAPEPAASAARPTPALPVQRRQAVRALLAQTARTGTGSLLSPVPPAPVSPLPPAITLLRPAIDSPPLTANPAPPQKPTRKQWKVVDLNEIDPGHQQPHAMASNRQPAMLRLKINFATQNR